MPSLYDSREAVAQQCCEADTARFQSGLTRIDSPLDTRHAVPAITMEDTTSAHELGLSVGQRPVMPPNARPKSAETGRGVRFIVVDHPDKLRDPSEMKKNRQHVMQDYLGKERMKPSSKDSRVNGLGATGKRKRSDNPSNGISANPAAPGIIFHQASASLTSAAYLHGNGSSEGSSDGGVCAGSGHVAASSGYHDPSANVSKAVSRPKIIAYLKDKSPLVPGISGRLKNYTYLGTELKDVPFAPNRLGAQLNPFDTWPIFNDPSVDVPRLKWSCSTRFGSYGMAQYWVPTLLKARHAFLSTICISSAHDDIMQRSAQPPDQRPLHESFERMQIRQEVTGMINQSMSDPQMQTTDTTMVAVLHLLNAEIMGCDDSVMRVHQSGLHAMVRQRGGLNNLGGNGQLASITTATMYIIAALRETLPHTEFVNFAMKQETSLPKESKPFPESPLYCRPAGYAVLAEVISPTDCTFKLLDTLRKLTRAFAALNSHSSPQNARTRQQRGEELQGLATELCAERPAGELRFTTMPEKYRYEAIRLTSRLWAHALANRVPFSEAAAQLSAPDVTAMAKPTHSLSMHIRIRNALMKTDTSDCWDHMAGVLFWITLVAGAAANPEAAPAGYITRRESTFSGEEEEARKWLAAITVRCSIVLGFEYGSSIMETLKRMIGIQQALRKTTMPWPTVQDIATLPGMPKTYGPSVPPPVAQVQRGFADFAQEFLDS